MSKRNSDKIIFKRITNDDIYNKLMEVETLCKTTSGMVMMNRKWLWSITGAFCAAFLFLITLIMGIK